MNFPGFKIYLELPGFPGDVTAKGYTNEIEVLSYHNNIQMVVGDVEGASIRFRKPVDRSTPRLLVACTLNEEIAHARFAFATTLKGGPKEFYRVTLTVVRIHNVWQIASDGTQFALAPTFSNKPYSGDALNAGTNTPGILEEVILNFKKITWEYIPPRKPVSGSLNIGGWDFENQRSLPFDPDR